MSQLAKRGSDFTTEEKDRLLKQFDVSGLRYDEFAREHNINAQTFKNWVSGGIKTFSALSSYLNTGKDDQTCFVDTSILFSATYDSDAFNSESEIAFDLLAEAGFSIFTNVNVRSEFLENHRHFFVEIF